MYSTIKKFEVHIICIIIIIIIIIISIFMYLFYDNVSTS